MDNLTHALTGALVCDALPFTKRLEGKAPLAAALVAAAPDLDMLPAIIANFPPDTFSRHALFAGELVRRFHRAESHSLFLYALVFIPLAYAGWWWSRKKGSVRQWALLVLLCLFSHTLLDWNNRYGIRPWLPFSDARYALGIFSLFDIPLLIILGTVFVFNHILRNGYRDPLEPPPSSAGLRSRTAARLNHRAGVTAVGMTGAALAAGRMLWAFAQSWG
jgi:membrane-bound metal-dependent hydrolase YbcI (DUF457 family)